MMIITHKAIPRRTLLKGVGVATLLLLFAASTALALDPHVKPSSAALKGRKGKSRGLPTARA